MTFRGWGLGAVVEDSTHPVRIELPVPFPLGSVNDWLFQGSHPVLVDCGLGSSRSYEALLAGLRASGQDPVALRLWITHGHVDHAGNAARLHRDFGVELAAPRVEAPFVETFRRDSVVRNDAFADALALHGMPMEDVRRLRADSDAIDRFLEDTPIQHDAPDGGRVVMGDQDVLVVRTPGHTPGSTSFLTEDNALLSGDTLLETITSNAIELLDSDRGNYHQYVATIEGLRRFVGCKALPGHLKPFDLTDAVIDRHLDAHRDRARRIRQLLHRPRTAWNLLPEVFPGLDRDSQLFMAMAELVGHLHALELEGQVQAQESEGVRRFRAVAA